MPKVDIRIEGINKLREILLKRYEALKKVLDQELLQVCEEAVTHAKENKGYRDHTANLKNSMSFALFFDGQLVTMRLGKIPHPEVAANGQDEVRENLMGYCQKDGVVTPKGYSLIIAPGMNYGKYVEAKGYSVVYMTKDFLTNEAQRALTEALQIVKELR